MFHSPVGKRVSEPSPLIGQFAQPRPQNLVIGPLAAVTDQAPVHGDHGARPPLTHSKKRPDLGDRVPPCDRWWPVTAGGKTVGRVSSAAWSPDFNTNVAIGMVRMTHWEPGTEVHIELPDGTRTGIVREKFWI